MPRPTRRSAAVRRIVQVVAGAVLAAIALDVGVGVASAATVPDQLASSFADRLTAHLEARSASEPRDPIASPDVGEHCADGLGADELTRFFGAPVGDFQGADYQRATRLPDDRVLWTFQDAFVAGRLVHNVAFVQSGRCFTRLGRPGRAWLLDGMTEPFRRWHWILDVAVDPERGLLHAFVVEMRETGASYLSRTRPVALRRVAIDADTLEVVATVDEPPTGDDLYGWSVTSDGEYTYLYSHCYQQFGFDTPLGIGSCAVDVKLARVPLGAVDGRREYWAGAGWDLDPAAAVPVIDGSFVLSGNNPAQVRYDGEHYLVVEKRDDWWGTTVEFGVGDRPEGPFRHVASVEEPLTCDRSRCNTYFASWVPWTEDGTPIWAIGHNRWDGAETGTHLADYRPTFHDVGARRQVSRTQLPWKPNGMR